MLNLTAMLIQLDNDRIQWQRTRAAYYLKTKFTPAELRYLRKRLEAGTYTIHLKADINLLGSEIGVDETTQVTIPSELIRVLRGM